VTVTLNRWHGRTHWPLLKHQLPFELCTPQKAFYGRTDIYCWNSVAESKKYRPKSKRHKANAIRSVNSSTNNTLPVVRPLWSSCLTALQRWGGSWQVINCKIITQTKICHSQNNAENCKQLQLKINKTYFKSIKTSTK